MADLLKINGKNYGIPNSLRLGESRMIKRITGLTPPEFNKAVPLLVKTQDPDILTALVWWVMHREDPSFTLDDIEALELGDIGGSDDGEADPKEIGVTPASASETSASSGNSASTLSSESETPSTQVSAGEPTRASGGGLALAHSGLGT